MKFVATLLAASFLLGTGLAAYADTEETTTTTTVQTTTSAPAFILPGGVTYMAVDPTSGVIGVYDPATRLINGRPLGAGWYVIEQSSGKVVATADTTGNLVAFSTIPTVLPTRFLIVNGNMIYFNSDYAWRRAKLEAQIASEFAAGHLTRHQVDDLRDELAKEASLEAKRKSDGTYSSSTVKDIEKKFAYVQSNLAQDLANTNVKRAKIGLTQ